MAGSGLVAPFAWLSARICNARSVVYLHGLDIAAPARIYRLFWHPFLRRFDRVLVNSRFTAGLAVKAGISAEKVSILHPGVSVPGATDAASEREEFRRRHDLDGAPIMLYVGRITARKGLARFVERSLPSIVAERPDARLAIVGAEPKQALLNATGERTRVDKALAANRLARNVLFLGQLSESALHMAYFAADVLVFPVRDHPHDIEGFGMVALEAAAHGLPTVAFAAGGVPDAVQNATSGDLIQPDDYTAFSRAVLSWLNVTSDERTEARERATAFAHGFSWPLFGQRLRELTWLEHRGSQ
jgi:phosphatidylinositol alpha-1,6-mannosyltransferase